MAGQKSLPTIDALKTQARRLRADLCRQGTELSHGKALELVARQYGYRDWNTAHAAAGNHPPRCPVELGERVAGQYLGQDFHGEVIGVQTLRGGRYRITLDFDEPVDVVTFESFSALRRRVRVTVDDSGTTAERTSNGVPHLRLSLSA